MKVGGPALAAVLAACSSASPTVIDGSSAASFAASVEAARRDLPVKDRLAFDAALKSPPGRRYGQSEAEVAELARQTYDKMTAAEVVEYAP